MEIVIPAVYQDAAIILEYRSRLFELLPISRIVIIGDDFVERLVEGIDERIHFVNEKSIINIDDVRKWITKYIGEKKIYRSGWYLQQFIKMAYAEICNDEYYLLWDCDTIPLKKVELFNDDNIPYFDLKKEFNQAYFQTINRLLGLKKIIPESFISEHMLIKASFMKELIFKIEERDVTRQKCFAEVIIEEAAKSCSFDVGFSEFETYGTFVTYYYPQTYVRRKWKSMRYGSFFYKNASQIREQDIKWLGCNYDAISFERSHNYSSLLGYMVTKNWVNKIFSSAILEIMVVFQRGRNKIKSLLCRNQLSLSK